MKKEYVNLNRSKNNLLNLKQSQVWVETVIYTLIGLTIMSIIIGVVTPKINQITDKAVLTQSKDTLNQINDQVQEILSATGSQRDILLTIKKGEYFIDGSQDSISYILRGTSALISQPNEYVKSGDINILTIAKSNKRYDVYLTLNYSAYNLTYNGKDVNKTLTTAPAGYRLLFINKGSTSSTIPKQIDIQSIGA